MGEAKSNPHVFFQFGKSEYPHMKDFGLGDENSLSLFSRKGTRFGECLF